jgi:flap endonuclease-1
MGVNLRDLLIRDEISIADLKGKTIAFDAYNMLYQFLANIRTADGQLLTDSKGRVTSHLIGLFSRVTRFMQEGIKPIFVFDGTPPTLKHKEVQKRKEIKQEAKEKYQEALVNNDVEGMKKYGARTSRLTKEMAEHAKELLVLLGVAVVQAPAEGEAQASYIVSQGDAWAVASQDYDCLLYGGTRLIQNMSIAGRRKKTKKLGTVTVKPVMINLKNNLENLKLTRSQLICLAMLVGTDYSPGGVKGLGPKKALKLVAAYGDNKKELFTAAKWDEHSDVSWQEVYELFENMPVDKKYTLEFGSIKYDELTTLLVKEYSFGEDRVHRTLDTLKIKKEKNSQKNLSSFFS